MRRLSVRCSGALERIRQAEELEPLLDFTLFAEPTPASSGWVIGRTREGVSLYATAGRKCFLLEGEGAAPVERVYAWLARHLDAAVERLVAFQADAAAAVRAGLVAPPRSIEELRAVLPPLVPPEDDAGWIALLGFDLLDDPPPETATLESVLPPGYDPAVVRRWVPISSLAGGVLLHDPGDEASLVLAAEGSIERLPLDLAVLECIVRPRLTGLGDRLASVRAALPEPWNAWSVATFYAFALVFLAIGSVVAGCVLAAVVALAGFGLSRVIALPDPPDGGSLVVGLSIGCFAIASVVVVAWLADD
jgi:hypothetical protein